MATESAHAAPARSRRDEDRLLTDTFRKNARTFALAGRLLPRSVRLPVATLYLYCRTVDEIADRRERPAASTRAYRLSELGATRSALADTLAGHPPPHGPNALLWRRLAEVHERCHLDESALAELLDGAQWDIDGRPINTVEDLVAYSELVAGSVGAMMLPLLVSESGGRAGLTKPARSLGVAMQITNILRDVGEDRAALGRVYLPTQLLARHGVEIADLRTGAAPGYASLCEELMDLAERLYDEAEAGIRLLPGAPRQTVRAASRMYREILNEVRAAGYDNLTRRAIVSPLHKLAAVAGGYALRRNRLRRAHWAGLS